MLKVTIKGKEEICYEIPAYEAIDIKYNCDRLCNPREIAEITTFVAGGEEDG